MEIKNLNQWVVWKKEIRDDKPTKILYQINGTRAKSTDPDTWISYETAKANQAGFDGIGFVFAGNGGLLGIDLDKILDEHGNFINEKAKEVYERSDSYAELSPSERGIHIIFETDPAFKLRASRSMKAAWFEVYNEKRFFTWTENPFGPPKAIRKIESAELENILAIAGYPWKSDPILDKMFA